jgi:two-component system, OmpR family, KDP operon response regulator KdpE
MMRRSRKLSATILIVEDDKTLAHLMREDLQDEGYEVLLANDGVEGVRIIQVHGVDLVLLDILMPRMDGWEACHQIREISDVPIIILTARGDVLDRVRGLELGADDYMAKPFNSIELLARIRAALRRRSYPITEQCTIQVDERLVIDRTHHEVFVDGRAVELSAIEFKLLACLLDNAGRISTHQSLLTRVWGWEYAEETDYLKVYIHHLRKKIEPDPGHPSYILTERGKGYRFQVPARS